MVCAVVYISAHSVRATYMFLCMKYNNNMSIWSQCVQQLKLVAVVVGVGNVASLLSNQDTRRKCRDVLISEVARVVAIYYLEWEVLFREVSSVQACPF